jgi:prolyl oligopeptidase
MAMQPSGEISKVKSLPSWFPTENYKVQQFETISKDGTRIPYFVVHSQINEN